MDFFFWFQLQTHKYNGHLIIIDIIKMTKKEKKTEKYSDDRCLTTTTKTTTIKMDSLCVYKYKNDDRIGLIVDIRKKNPKRKKEIQIEIDE